ncbi:short-subunit dehydrogenase [Allonocardiopsis opalescens]|uniref:Short-subunit dehydrogenase n=2 Tax=Allonocardiopsis opalescens TaxID=1144618 RepID=A0A2T0Q2B1_9ACTN|nr:short-subunit dehydrogenase [Allonocardiopsis opalescens]
MAGALVAGAVVGARMRAARDLTGKTALVTGGSRGLGLLLAREFGRAGCRVLICARDGEELDRAVSLLREQGVDAHARACDLRDPDQTAGLVRRVRAEGGLDLLVNNAGIIQVGPVEAMTDDDFADAMDTMFWAPYRLTRALLPELALRRGHLVTISSVGGRISVPHLLPYSCAKFAEAALSQGLDAESAGTGVKVTTVVPGLMRTGSHQRVELSGRPRAEYGWFSLGASLPLVSMDAERAAAQIVQAVRKGRRHVVLTPLARLAVLADGASPGLTQWALRATGRLMPAAPARRPGRQGGAAARERTGKVMRALTGLNDAAARRFNQRREAAEGAGRAERAERVPGR